MDRKALQRKRELILTNAERLLTAARLLVGKEFDHIRYHLATLSLEEVGKAELVGIKALAAENGDEEGPSEEDFTDHVRKLFWAIWGPSLGRQKITSEQLQLHERIATTIHETRMGYLYADPDDPILPENRVDPEALAALWEIAEARLEMAKSYQLRELDAEDVKLLEWFRLTTRDHERRKEIFGSKSMEKLAELGSTTEWMSWLRETYRQNDSDVNRLAQRELDRSRGLLEKSDDPELAKPKWRMKLRLYSHSHSIRQKPLNVWNAFCPFIQLTATGKSVYSTSRKDEMMCVIEMPARIPAGALWEHGWGLSRVFVTSLNIASRGFFWWYVPRDTERYYEEILDLEGNVTVFVQPTKKLELDWGNLVLSEADMRSAALVFGYASRYHGRREFDKYISGLTLLSKSDWHFRLELNAFEEFWEALREALRGNKHLEEGGSFSDAACAQIGEHLKSTMDLVRHIELGERLAALKVEGRKGPMPEVSLTEVIGMKLYCDVYLLLRAREFAEEARAKGFKDGD